MDSKSARQHVSNCKKDKYVATTCFRKGVIAKLSRDDKLKKDYSCVLVEMYLTENLPDIESFSGIFEVDTIGIWYYDGDGHIDDPIWRQRVIPWKYIKTVVIHQAS